MTRTQRGNRQALRKAKQSAGRALLVAAVAFASVSFGCGGASSNGSATSPAPGTDVDGDALALLPASPVAVVHLDVKAAFKAQSVGASVTMLAARAVPAGDASGFDPSRDLDEITAGAYSLEGVDVAAVLRGRFDVQKINSAADAQVAASGTGGGGTLFVKSSYADHTLYTVSNAGFCTLTSKTLLAGTETGIRRMLDKIRDKKIGRELDATMAATVSPPANPNATPTDDAGAASTAAPILFAANFHATQVPNIAPLPWLRAVDSARILANFDDPGLNVAGRLSFPDATAAQAGSDGLKGLGTLAAFAAAGGLAPQIQKLDVKIVQNDVTVKFAVDDGQLRTFLARVTPFLAQH